MTVVAVWFEPTDDAVWSVADTRISAVGASGGTIIRTDSGAKLFSLPVVCRKMSTAETIHSNPHFSTSFGFSFAGDTLPATMTFATASTFLQNLVTSGSANPPLLRDIARLVRTLAERYSRESLAGSNGKYGQFEAAIFGWCPHLARFAIYHLFPKLNSSSFSVEIKEHLPVDESYVQILGSGRERLTAQIELIRANGDRFLRKGLVPKLAAEAIIEEDKGDVGGSLSVGIATRWRYDLYSWVRPVEPGKPQAIFSFNGINLATEIENVGHYIIGLNGIA
jgi:hypothetical protein